MRKDKAYLQDILDAIGDIEKFLEKVTEEEFYRNKEKQYAVLRALEIIGEATKNLSKEIRVKISCNSMERHCWNEGQADPYVLCG
jgi:uncharacterized protein with HEPN domain